MTWPPNRGRRSLKRRSGAKTIPGQGNRQPAYSLKLACIATSIRRVCLYRPRFRQGFHLEAA